VISGLLAVWFLLNTLLLGAVSRRVARRAGRVATDAWRWRSSAGDPDLSAVEVAGLGEAEQPVRREADRDGGEQDRPERLLEDLREGLVEAA
jgi:hypothetical protein